MEISFHRNGRKWVADVWPEQPPEDTGQVNFSTEDDYVEINNWCIETLKYHARTAYSTFEFKSRRDLEWFVLRWS